MENKYLRNFDCNPIPDRTSKQYIYRICRELNNIYGCSMTDDEKGVSLWSDDKKTLFNCKSRLIDNGIISNLIDNWKNNGDKYADHWRIDINY